MTKTNLLYIHAQGIQSSNTGGLNTTLLQVFSMCNAFERAGYKVTLAMENSDDFENNLKEFTNNTFKDGIKFTIKTWKRKHKKRLPNRIIVKPSVLKIVKETKSDLIFTREAYILNDLVKLGIPVIFESHNAKLHTRYNLIHKYLENKLIRASKSSNFICLFSISRSLSNYWEQQGFSKST